MRPLARSMVAASLVACSASTPQETQEQQQKSPDPVSDTAGLTREVLRRGPRRVAFGSSPVPALRANSLRQSLVVGGRESCVLASAGAYADRVLCWSGSTPKPAVVPLPDSAVQLAAGANHTCALTTQGDVYCWGSNSNGQLGVDPKQVAFSAAPVKVTRGDFTFSQLAAGGNSTCALTPRSVAYCWGANESGQLGTGDLQDAHEPKLVVLQGLITQIAVGKNHGCAMVADQPVFSLWCWGDASSGQIGGGAGGHPVQPGSALYPAPYLVVHAFGPDPVVHGYNGQQALLRVAMGARHSCALSTYGADYCWGDDSDGQLGASNLAPNHTDPMIAPYTAADFGAPMASDFFYGGVQIVSGDNHACVLVNDLSCWGDSSQGQLGPSPQPPSANSATVIPPPAGVRFIDLAAGADRACAAGTDGQVYCWGGGNAEVRVVPGGPYFDDLRAGPVVAGAPAGSALVDCQADPNVGIAPGPLTSYLFDLDGVFAHDTMLTEVQFDLQASQSSALTQLELGVYAWKNGVYTKVGSTRAVQGPDGFGTADPFSTLTLRFIFPGQGLRVPEGAATLQITERSGQILFADSHSILNAGTDACPTDLPYQIPVRIFTR